MARGRFVRHGRNMMVTVNMEEMAYSFQEIRDRTLQILAKALAIAAVRKPEIATAKLELSIEPVQPGGAVIGLVFRAADGNPLIIAGHARSDGVFLSQHPELVGGFGNLFDEGSERTLAALMVRVLSP